MKDKYFKINFQKESKAFSLLYIITLLWSSASNFQIKKEPPTSRHFVNKLALAHSNSGLSKVQNQMRKKYFRIASGWIIWKYFFPIYSVMLESIILILRWPLSKLVKSTSFLHMSQNCPTNVMSYDQHEKMFCFSGNTAAFKKYYWNMKKERILYLI